MANINSIIEKIKNEQISLSSKRVLLLEGSDDVNAFEHFLHKRKPDWELNWVLAIAGKKANVIDILSREPDWLGIVDRDEWSSEKIQEYENKYPNLIFLPRFCIENYLSVPEELWSALPILQQQKIDQGFSEFSRLFTKEISMWVNHGVLWSVINPLWEGLRSLGFKESLLDPSIATDNQRIREILHLWHQYLDPESLIEQINEKRKEILSLPIHEQLSCHVHGKKFYESFISPLLAQLLGQERASQRQAELFRTLPIPADLNLIWQKMEL